MSQYGEQIGFAGGTMIVNQVGVSGAVTPQRVGILQNASTTVKVDTKMLYGQGRFAVAIAPGKTTIEIDVESAGIRGALWNTIVFGATTTATQTLFADAEAGVVSATPYTVTAANGAAFLEDKGVFYAATAAPLVKVASAPTTGQYSVSAAGVYTFAAADTGLGVYVSYTYSSTAGIQIPITNPKMGAGPTFKTVLAGTFDGRPAVYIYNLCIAQGLDLSTKQDDYQMNKFKIQCAADIFGNVGSINLSL